MTLFGAKASGTGAGWDDLNAIFRTVASWFSDSTKYDFEVVAAGASSDLAYTVGYEHNRVKVEGQPQTYTLRVTMFTAARTDNGASSTDTPTYRQLTTGLAAKYQGKLLDRRQHPARADDVKATSRLAACLGGVSNSSIVESLQKD